MGSYTVKANDSWSSIAGSIWQDQRLFNVLAAANPNISMLHPGMVIKIPDIKGYLNQLEKKGQLHYVSPYDVQWANNYNKASGFGGQLLQWEDLKKQINSGYTAGQARVVPSAAEQRAAFTDTTGVRVEQVNGNTSLVQYPQADPYANMGVMEGMGTGWRSTNTTGHDIVIKPTPPPTVYVPPASPPTSIKPQTYFDPDTGQWRHYWPQTPDQPSPTVSGWTQQGLDPLGLPTTNPSPGSLGDQAKQTRDWLLGGGVQPNEPGTAQSPRGGAKVPLTPATRIADQQKQGYSAGQAPPVVPGGSTRPLNDYGVPGIPTPAGNIDRINTYANPRDALAGIEQQMNRAKPLGTYRTPSAEWSLVYEDGQTKWKFGGGQMLQSPTGPAVDTQVMGGQPGAYLYRDPRVPSVRLVSGGDGYPDLALPMDPKGSYNTGGGPPTYPTGPATGYGGGAYGGSGGGGGGGGFTGYAPRPSNVNQAPEYRAASVLAGQSRGGYGSAPSRQQYGGRPAAYEQGFRALIGAVTWRL